MKRLITLNAIFALLIAAQSMAAPVIISVTGSVTGATGLVPSQTITTSWIQSDPFVNVSINAIIGGPVGTGTSACMAYLTNQVGPGATAANLIASAPFTSTDVFTDTNLFSGLTLPASTYYLVLHSEQNGFWDNSTTPTITTAPGVSANGVYIANNNNAFPPSDTFFSDSRNFLYSVTGSAVPEPSTMSILFTGGVILAGFALRKRG
jgi:PEP-CTERM motif